MPKEKTSEDETVLTIECKIGHKSPYHPKDPDNLPKRIRCPATVGGRTCKAPCKVIDEELDDVVSVKNPDAVVSEVKTTTAPSKTTKKTETSKRERLQYDLDFCYGKMCKEARHTFDEVHSYITHDADLKPYFTKYFIIYKKDGKTTVQIRVARKYIKLYFNSKDVVEHEKVSDISNTTRGSNFKYMMSKIIYNDILLVKRYVDKSLK